MLRAVKRLGWRLGWRLGSGEWVQRRACGTATKRKVRNLGKARVVVSLLSIGRVWGDVGLWDRKRIAASSWWRVGDWLKEGSRIEAVLGDIVASEVVGRGVVSGARSSTLTHLVLVVCWLIFLDLTGAL